MARPLALAALLLLATFAGCLQDSDPSGDLRGVFGPSAVEQRNGTVFIVDPVLEGQAEGTTTWSPSLNLSIDVPKITLQKADPGPQGGGGTTKPLELPASAVAFKVRFQKADKLGGYEAHWDVERTVVQNFTWSEPQEASKEFPVSVTGPGPVFVVAELLKDGKVVATVSSSFVASMTVHWVVESAVRPIRAQDPAPPPPNYDAMSDKFPIELPSEGATLVATTKYRGTYTPGSGTDVDLEVDPPGGKATCSGSGGGGQAAPVDEAQATEKITIKGMGAGTARIVVGAGDETKCAMTFFYNNPGMVPYTLDVTLTF
jgi:hypothetical protein